jgi:hypothetical protein
MLAGGETTGDAAPRKRRTLKGCWTRFTTGILLSGLVYCDDACVMTSVRRPLRGAIALGYGYRWFHHRLTSGALPVRRNKCVTRFYGERGILRQPPSLAPGYLLPALRVGALAPK